MAEDTTVNGQITDVVKDQQGKLGENPVTVANKYKQHKDNPVQNPLPGPGPKPDQST